jgi:hypothetical protein
MNTALVFWVCCVAYPAFTLLQSFVLIWLTWRFRDEISLAVSDALAWRPRSWRMRHLPTWSPHATSEEPAIYIRVDDKSSLATGVHT